MVTCARSGCSVLQTFCVEAVHMRCRICMNVDIFYIHCVVASLNRCLSQYCIHVQSKSWILKEPQTKGELAAGRTMYGAAVCGDLRLVPGSVVRLGTRTFIAAGNSDDEVSERSDDKDASEGGDAAAAGEQTDADGDVLRGAGEGVVAHQLPVLTRGLFALVQCIFTELAENGESSPRFQVRISAGAPNYDDVYRGVVYLDVKR